MALHGTPHRTHLVYGAITVGHRTVACNVGSAIVAVARLMGCIMACQHLVGMPWDSSDAPWKMKGIRGCPVSHPIRQLIGCSTR